MPTAVVLAALIALTAASAFLDAKGFVYAARAWREGSLDWRIGAISFSFTMAGVALYIFSIGLHQKLGIQSAAVQSVFWFAMTVIGIALLDGSIAQWSWAQRFVAAAVSVGIGWLLVTASH